MSRVFSLSTLACVCVGASEPSSLSKHILDVLECYRIPTDIDKESIGRSRTSFETAPLGYDVLEKKIHTFIEAKQPLRFFMVSFPFKSANTEKKVISEGVDLAERKSLEYLYQCIKELKSIYPYGVELVIFCDGMPFAEFRAVSDAAIKKYEADLQKLCQDMPEITLITSQDIEQKLGVTGPRQACQRMDSYLPSDEDAYKQIKDNPRVKESYETLLERFRLEFDFDKGRAFLSQNGGIEAIIKKLIVREMRMRVCIEDLFPPSTYIRLTVHYSTDVGKKFGIRLSPDSCIMPYHGVLVEEGPGAWPIRFKKDIDLRLYEETSRTVNGIACRYMRPRHH